MTGCSTWTRRSSTTSPGSSRTRTRSCSVAVPTTTGWTTGRRPTSDVQPFAGFINATPKHVFTSTPPLTSWAGSRIVDGPPAEHVAELKREPGGDIGVHGSLTLAQTLLRAGLVDELRLVVAPTLAGRGGRLFDSSPFPQRLQLVDEARSSGGNLLLHYLVS